MSHFFFFTMSSTPETASQPTKVALITGITGQDGSYLAELLLEKVVVSCVLDV